MARYGVEITAFVTGTATKTAALLHANGAGERGELLEFLLGGDGTVTPSVDVMHRAFVQGYDATTAGTPGSTPAGAPLDQWAKTANILAPIEFSAEPTVLTPGPIRFSFNTRGGWSWARSVGSGAPFYNRASGLVGWACCVSAAAPASVDGHVHWDE